LNLLRGLREDRFFLVLFAGLLLLSARPGPHPQPRVQAV
jgi:hypothetical protein